MHIRWADAYGFQEIKGVRWCFCMFYKALYATVLSHPFFKNSLHRSARGKVIHLNKHLNWTCFFFPPQGYLITLRRCGWKQWLDLKLEEWKLCSNGLLSWIQEKVALEIFFFFFFKKPPWGPGPVRFIPSMTVSMVWVTEITVVGLGRSALQDIRLYSLPTLFKL